MIAPDCQCSSRLEVIKDNNCSACLLDQAYQNFWKTISKIEYIHRWHIEDEIDEKLEEYAKAFTNNFHKEIR